eukprot:COSAG02_NODE_3199_length_7185_cov_9.666949_2_plen_139_part_00
MSVGVLRTPPFYLKLPLGCYRRAAHGAGGAAARVSPLHLQYQIINSESGNTGIPVAVPVDKEIIPYRVNFATSRPLRAFKPPFSRAPTLQHQLPGSGEPSHTVLRRVVLVVSAVSSAFKNWATFGRGRNSALVGELWH